MVKKLWLLRHGKAQQSIGQKDFERPLTFEGRDRIEQVGTQVRSVCNPDLVLCSAAVRTRQTADYFLAQLSTYGRVIYTDVIYEAAPEKLLELINDQGSGNALLMIGHNPGISSLVDLLTGQSFTNLSPGDLAEVEFNDLNWHEVGQGTGILRSR